MPHRTARTVLAALLPALCIASSAQAQASRSVARDERACRAEQAPTTLPSADALVNAPALVDEAARLWRESGSARGYVLLTLLYDRDGLNVRRDVIEHSVPDEVADSLQRLVFAHLRRTGLARAEWGVRFRVDLGEEPALSVARREVCTPVPSGRLAMAGSGSVAVNPDLVWVRVKLDPRGLVTDARVERGMLRDASEAYLLTQVRSMAFLPALADGHPVAGETMIPVRVAQ